MPWGADRRKFENIAVDMKLHWEVMQRRAPKQHSKGGIVGYISKVGVSKGATAAATAAKKQEDRRMSTATRQGQEPWPGFQALHPNYGARQVSREDGTLKRRRVMKQWLKEAARRLRWTMKTKQAEEKSRTKKMEVRSRRSKQFQTLMNHHPKKEPSTRGRMYHTDHGASTA